MTEHLFSLIDPMAPTPPYVELRCRSAFSFLDGASAPEDLLQRAGELGYSAIALSDRGGIYGAPRFFRASRKGVGPRPIVGAELPVQDAAPILLLVENRRGYQNLCRLITTMKVGFAKNDPTSCATLEQIETHSAGLIALGGPELRSDTDRMLGIFGKDRFFVEAQHHFDDAALLRNRRTIDHATAMGIGVVATNDVRYALPEQRGVQDILTCAREKTTVDGIGRRLHTNNERFLKTPAAMAQLLSFNPRTVQNTLRIAERCEFTLADLGYTFPRFPVPEGQNEHSLLEHLTWEGAQARYGRCDRAMKDKVRKQLRHELNIIGRLSLAGYFLVVWDIVRYARTLGILVQGRGSAANSAVCFALGITAVDPVGMELLFERFLSEERVQSAPNAADRIPDIDLDLPSGTRREAVIQYVYRRYKGAAMTANVITYRPRMAVRTVGRALGFGEAEMSRMSKHLPYSIGPEDTPLLEILASAGFPATERRTRHLAEIATQLLDLPRHLGQHSGGMVLCAGRLDEIVPLEPASMENRTVVQWDKDDCADLGIVKVDLLGLGMLAVLEEAVPLIQQHEGIAIDYAHLPADDPKVYDMLCKADTVGVFQVESRAQMATLPRMLPRRFYDLVVEVAIIRPGPIVGKMVNPYLERRAGRQKVTYPHPALEPILKRTLGIPLFQEQLIRMAMAVANFSGGQAEALRRAMGFKRSEKRMREIEHDLRVGMTGNGIVGEAQEEIVRGIQSFAMYGFPESHAASFALIAYASAYLKAHHGAAFLCALLNNYPMGFYHPSTLVSDAARHGIETLPVDVAHSDWNCTLEGQPPSKPKVRLGLKYVAGLRAEAGERIMTERKRRPFVLLGDFSARVTAQQDEMIALTEAGAFSSLGGNRRAALWQVEALGRSGALFARAQGNDDDSPLPEMTVTETLHADLRRTGLSTMAHPVGLARPELQRMGIVAACVLADIPDGQMVRIGGIVIVRQRPGTAKGVIFVTLEDETGFANAIVMPNVYEKWRKVIVSHPALLIEGRIQNRNGVIHIKAERFAPLGPGAESYGETDWSRDFH
ncbi:MAG: error-prone DNA polymerase [Deltaproteobacteria bacterium]|nr:error-prone DNA polymerase [Deltaproteobacteria bacterium]